MHGAWVSNFDAELVEDHRAVILTCHRTVAQPRRNFVEISTLDLRSGISSLELVSRVLDSFEDAPYSDCAVCGDIVAVYFGCQVLLINWRTSTRVLVQTSYYYSHSQISLVPGYLVLSLPSEYRLAVSPFGSLSSWEPVDIEEEPSAHIKAENLSIGANDSIALAGNPVGYYHPLQKSIWVHESPLQRGRFQVWLHASVNDTPTLFNYQFDAGTGVSWRFLSAIPMLESPTKISPAGITLSGHTLSKIWRGLEIIPPIPATKDSARRLTMELPGYGEYSDHVHLSSFSGALTCLAHKELVVVYYD
ncbi:hypothetical protein B0H19DRAFT_349349 [Mycena capillaripes]|nr:hypothetical protein B0H19DRAFT_349349 [Mycena capillaripes]